MSNRARYRALVSSPVLTIAFAFTLLVRGRSSFDRECNGFWVRLLTEVQTRSDAVGEIVLGVSVYSTNVRAYQHTVGIKKGR